MTVRAWWLACLLAVAGCLDGSSGPPEVGDSAAADPGAPAAAGAGADVDPGPGAQLPAKPPPDDPSSGPPPDGTGTAPTGDAAGTELDGAKIDRFLELNVLGLEASCACFGCGPGDPDFLGVAECQADWYRANHDAATECMLDIANEYGECVVAATASCDLDAVIACEPIMERLESCGPPPEGLLACASGLPGFEDASSGSAGAGGDEPGDSGDGGQPAVLPEPTAADECRDDQLLFSNCITYCFTKNDTAECLGDTHDQDACMEACLGTGGISQPGTSCAERLECLSCEMPYAGCYMTWICSDFNSPPCTADACLDECQRAG